MRRGADTSDWVLSARVKRFLLPSFLTFTVAEAIYTWHDIGKPYLWNTGLFSLIIGHGAAIYFLLEMILHLRWFQARVALALWASILAIGFVANLVSVHTEPEQSAVRFVILLLWVAAALVSLNMCYSTLRSRPSTK